MSAEHQILTFQQFCELWRMTAWESLTWHHAVSAIERWIPSDAAPRTIQEWLDDFMVSRGHRHVVLEMLRNH